MTAVPADASSAPAGCNQAEPPWAGWFRGCGARSSPRTKRETVRRGIAKVRAAADWLETAVDNGEFTLDEQLVQLLKGE